MKFFEDCEGITEPQGFFASGVPCNVMGKNNGKLDLGLLYSPRACTAAGTFTTNDVKASPVLYCMDLLNDPKQNFHGVLSFKCTFRLLSLTPTFWISSSS